MKSKKLLTLLITLSFILGICFSERVEANEKKEVTNQINQIYIGFQSYHVLGRDGSVWAAGFNPYGGLGWSGSGNKGELRVIPSAKNIVSISANLHSYGVTQEGAIFRWNGYFPTVIFDSVKKVKTLATGINYCVVLTEEGRVWTWGGNYVGQLGIGDSNDRSEPTLIPNLEEVIEIASSPTSGTVYALKRDGSVWGWGSNGNYQLGTNGDKSLVPTRINIPVKIKHIYQSKGNTFVYGAAIDENNSVWWWGKDYPSKVKSSVYGEPVLDQGIKSVKQLALGKDHALALKDDGTVLAWGKNSGGQLGDGTNVERTSPEPVPGLTDIYSIDAGDRMSGAVSDSSDVYIWGSFHMLGSITSPKRISIDDQPSEVLPIEKPTDLKLKVTSVNSVQLSWDQTKERSNDWNKYNIYLNNQIIETTKDKIITINNIDPTKEYNLFVTTKGILGNESEASNSVKKRGIEKYSYSYNSAGQLTGILFGSGKKISYEYDKNGNLKKTTVVNP
ncbi:hypothetical protein CXK86_07445 [Paenibacillus sp. BGI2013]|uniref:RCC1 domain-containing protein n=1 Tax=Paenibacillus TaxID=44249 RepID=UPI00096D4270|nr:MULTISPECIES: hypothetical protein [Paenibacillus]OMF45198.1 hypothetical protein BK136_08750 [Paenibacillus amylolyticus]PKQ91158.1 hypothetical protein CXK86_07445 [Paenibacillus sp. BGI2013]